MHPRIIETTNSYQFRHFEYAKHAPNLLNGAEKKGNKKEKMKGKKCQKKMTQLLSLTEAISVFEGRHTERVNERALAYVRASTRVRSFACAQACAGVGGFLYANVRESVRRQDDITHTYPLSSSHGKKNPKRDGRTLCMGMGC